MGKALDWSGAGRRGSRELFSDRPTELFGRTVLVSWPLPARSTSWYDVQLGPGFAGPQLGCSRCCPRSNYHHAAARAGSVVAVEVADGSRRSAVLKRPRSRIGRQARSHFPSQAPGRLRCHRLWCDADPPAAELFRVKRHRRACSLMAPFVSLWCSFWQCERGKSPAWLACEKPRCLIPAHVLSRAKKKIISETKE